jgi:D-arabinose 1-dehydrogenase-like Zn-dependent alcohol dehydrogenase
VNTTESVPDVVIAVEATQGAAVIGRVVEGPSQLQDRRVLAGPFDACGQCEICRRGGAAVCPTAVRRETIGDRVRVAGRWVVPLGDGLELPVPEGAAVAGDVALAYTLYARTGIAPREPVVIVGASPVARFLVEILLAKSVTPVVIADPTLHAWRSWLTARGAATAGNATEAAAAIAAQGTGARPWRVIAAAPDAALVAAELAGPRATLTVLAPCPTLPGALADREVTILAVAGPHPDLVVEAAAMCVKGEIDLRDGVSTSRNAVMRSIVVQR